MGLLLFVIVLFTIFTVMVIKSAKKHKVAAGEIVLDLIALWIPVACYVLVYIFIPNN